MKDSNKLSVMNNKLKGLPPLNPPLSKGGNGGVVTLTKGGRRGGSSSLAADREGFTLLEVLIAIAIVGGLLVTVIYTLNYNLGIAEKHETVTVATVLAKDKMLEMEKNPVNVKGEYPAPYAGYRYSTEVKSGSYPGMSEIIVIVNNGREEVRLAELIKQ